MKVQYLIDGIEISRDIFYNSNKGIAKKEIKITFDHTLEDFNKLKAHLKSELQYVSEKWEQKFPEQEYPKPPRDSFNKNEKHK